VSSSVAEQGFIGSHLVDWLVAEGAWVTVVDDLSTGRVENLDAALATGRCELAKHSVTETGFGAIVGAVHPEVVFHLAAQIDVRSSVADPVGDANANVLGTVAVLEAARQAGTRKVVFASSVAVYGPPAALPVREDTPPSPLSPYAVSKLAGEPYLRQYRELHGLQTTALVLTNTYGPRQDPHGEAGVVAIFTAAMLAGRPTRVYGAGANERDYCPRWSWTRARPAGYWVGGRVRRSPSGSASPRRPCAVPLHQPRRHSYCREASRVYRGQSCAHIAMTLACMRRCISIH